VVVVVVCVGWGGGGEWGAPNVSGRRPVLGSSWVAGQLSLAVDAFNFLNTEWEPIVEPWQCGFAFAAVDLGEYGSEAAVYARGRTGSGSSSSLHGAGAGSSASGSYVYCFA
jgi:hypothetical protein